MRRNREGDLAASGPSAGLLERHGAPPLPGTILGHMPPGKLRRAALCAVTGACLVGASPAQVAQAPVDGVDLFEAQIRPLFERSCFKCHGDPERAMSELLLTTRGGLLLGGARGPALDTAEPEDSLILRAVGYDDPQMEMPPTGKLSEDQIAALTQWVRLGAPYGGDEDQLASVAREDVFEISAEDRSWWSVAPLERPRVPDTAEAGWARNDIDRFLLAGLERAGLTPAETADRRTLIRRATYDLTGLPPTLAEVRAFESDTRADAWQRVIDRLLASPHYGEKWGRHWLDLVRFAETMGYERDSEKPGAWRYRDWVISALNADMPYDEFLVHQLAGDEIDHPTRDSLIATGYLRLAIWDDEPTDLPLAQYDDLDSILDTTSRVMLGMSMGCARCHNHRGDPIPQSDYYSMLSFFRGIAPYKVDEGNAPNPENYVDHLPADWGRPEEGAQTARFLERRARRVESVRSIYGRTIEAATSAQRQAGSAERARGLVAHYAFEETRPLVALDGAGSGHGRIEDVTTGVAGVSGRAFSFDGDDDAVTVPRPIADDFTISLWFRTEATANAGFGQAWYLGSSLVDGNSAGNANDFGLALVGNGYVTAGTGNPYRIVTSDPGYHDGAWHHVAMTRERATGLVRLYVDGEPVGEVHGNTESLDAAEVLEIGRLQVGGGSSFQGDLDELRFYDRALSHRQVLDQYLGGGALESDRALVRAHDRRASRQLATAVAELLEERRPDRGYAEILRIKELGPEAPATHVLIRGNPHAPAEEVQPGFPRILTDLSPQLPARTDDDATTGRRLALARWIASDGNIRTSRVIANRLWQYHFGRGIVPTPNDFGHFGQAPTHPELLDWLATELVARNWSLKAMHRLIMTSSAYLMSSRSRPRRPRRRPGEPAVLALRHAPPDRRGDPGLDPERQRHDQPRDRRPFGLPADPRGGAGHRVATRRRLGRRGRRRKRRGGASTSTSSARSGTRSSTPSTWPTPTPPARSASRRRSPRRR